MSGILKLLPVAALAGLGYTQRETVQEFGSTAIDLARSAATKFEMRTFETAVTAEKINGNMREVVSDFPAYLQHYQRS